MPEVILQNGQRIVEKSRRWSKSVGRSTVSWSAGIKDGGLDFAGALDSVRWGSDPSESPGKREPLCIG